MNFREDLEDFHKASQNNKAPSCLHCCLTAEMKQKVASDYPQRTSPLSREQPILKETVAIITILI